MKKITKDEYFKATNSTPSFMMPDITLEEAQTFLNNRGYHIIIVKVIRETQMIQSIWGTGEVEKVGDPIMMVRDVVYAVHQPDVVYTHYEPERDFYNVFVREFKKKLLS